MSMRLLLGWAINAGVLLLLPYVTKAVQINSFGAALIAALVIGLLNVLLKPILILLTLPVTILTMGLFLFVLNGFTFWLAARMLPGFEIASFWWAVLAAIIYTVITSVVGAVLFKQDA